MGGPNLAVLDGADNGIQFGAEGLTIGLRPGQERLAKSRLGSYYAKHPDLPSKGRSLFVPDDSGKAKAELTELQVCSLLTLSSCRAGIPLRVASSKSLSPKRAITFGAMTLCFLLMRFI